MKKIILSILISSQLLMASSDTPTDYTIEEMLNGMYKESDKIEGLTKDSGFKYMYKYMSDFSEKEQEMFNKIYLYYLHKFNLNKEKYKKLTENVLTSIDKMKDIQSMGKYITLQDSKNINIKVLNNITYFVDFENESIYSSEMQSFVQNDFDNLFSILYQVEYNRILIFEPKNQKTSYFSIVNLGDTKTFSFKDLKETIRIYMEKTSKAKEINLNNEGI